MTHLTTTSSMRAHGGLSPDVGETRCSLQLRAGMSGVSVPALVAGRIPMSALRWHQGLATAFDSVAACELRSRRLGDGRNDLLGHAHPTDNVVAGDVVGDHPEERRQRSAAEAGVGLGKLSNRLGMAA